MTSVASTSMDTRAAIASRMAGIEKALDARIAEARARGPVDDQSAAKAPASEDRSIDETTRGGLKVAETARDDIEFLTSMVAQYNSSKSILETPKEQDAVRLQHGDQRADMRLELARKNMESAKQQMDGMQQRMAQLYKVSGSILEKDAGGSFTLGDFTLAQSRSGWSMTVDANGAAKVTANGADVSGLVDNTKNNGERWDDAGATVDTYA